MRTIKITKFQLTKIVVANGKRIDSDLNTSFLNHSGYIRKKEYQETAQAVYLLLRRLYLIKFKVTLGLQQRQTGYDLDLYDYNITPYDIELIEYHYDKI